MMRQTPAQLLQRRRFKDRMNLMLRSHYHVGEKFLPGDQYDRIDPGFDRFEYRDVVPLESRQPGRRPKD